MSLIFGTQAYVTCCAIGRKSPAFDAAAVTDYAVCGKRSTEELAPFSRDALKVGPVAAMGRDVGRTLRAIGTTDGNEVVNIHA